MSRRDFERPSPWGDIAESLRRTRVDSRANDIGNSSIGPGQGSIDVRNAAGQDVARVGDDGSGTMGLLVPGPGGTWVPLADPQPEYDRIDGRIDTAEGRITSAENTLSSHAGRLNSAEGRITSAEGRLDSHAGRLSTAEGTLSSHGGRITSAENGISSLGSSVSNLQGRMSTVEGQAAGISGLTNRVSTLEGEVAELRSWRTQLLIWLMGDQSTPPPGVGVAG